MMQLLIEELFTESLETLTESTIEGKNYFIEGIFMQADVRNGNGRIYPKSIMEKQVEAYQSLISDNRSLSELGHPKVPTPNIDYENVSHRITSLYMEGNNVIGKAKIITTLPKGLIAKALIDEGVKLGVSSRGLGSVTARNGTNFVGNDFVLKAVDIVHEPSAPNAFVKNINEGMGWDLIDGEWKPVSMFNEELYVNWLDQYVSKIKNNK